MKSYSAILVMVLVVVLLGSMMAGCSSPAPSTPAPATSKAPATSATPATSKAPATTSAAPTTTSAPATSKAPTTTSAPATSKAAAPITFSYVGFSAPTNTYDMISDWIKVIKDRSGGVINVNYKGGPEVIPAFEQVDNMRKGLIDMCAVPTTYASSVVYESNAPDALFMSSIDARKNGFLDMMEEIYNKNNIHLMMMAQSHKLVDGIRFYTNKQIAKPEDINGQKVRATAAYINMLKSWGASVVTLPGDKIYEAMQRGTIDSFISPLSALTFASAWPEVTKYYVSPGFSRGSMSLFMNLAKWKQLSPELQKMATDTMIEIEGKWEAEWMKRESEFPVKLEAAGVKRITFSKADGDKFVKSFFDFDWKDIIEHSPTYGPKLKALSGLPAGW